MEQVKAKFKVTKLEVYEGDLLKVFMSAVIKDKSNVDWSKWTPNGSIEMTITNPEVLDYFVPGEEIDVLMRKGNEQ